MNYVVAAAAKMVILVLLFLLLLQLLLLLLLLLLMMMMGTTSSSLLSFFLNATVCGDLHTGQTSWLISTRFIFGVCWYNSFRLIVDFGFSGCQFNGQFLPNNYDECSYFRCDYGPEPYYDVYGKIKFVEVKMKCPYGTSTNRYRFDPYNPCGEASYKCSAPPPPSKFD